MFKIGGKFDYEYKSNNKIILKQKRLNIIHIRISIPLKTTIDKRKKSLTYNYKNEEIEVD